MDTNASLTLLQQFSNEYNAHYHATLVIFISTFGIIANAINIVVLSRRSMLINPTNVIFCGLSISQMMLLFAFLVRTIYTYHLDDNCSYAMKTKFILYLVLFNANFTLVCHSISVVLVVLLGLFRYLIIHYVGKNIINNRKATAACICAFVLVPISCGSFYLNSAVTEFDEIKKCPNYDPERTAYCLSIADPTTLYVINLMIFGVFCKMVPCISLAIVSTLLIIDLQKAQKRRKRLFNGNVKRSTSNSDIKLSNTTQRKCPSNSAECNRQRRQSSNFKETERQHYNVTAMLILILFLFIIVELPQGIISQFYALELMKLTDYRYGELWYRPTGDFFEMLTILYSSINFILYCLMSSQFRAIFKQTFIPKRCLGNRSKSGIRLQEQEKDLPPLLSSQHASRSTRNGGRLSEVNLIDKVSQSEPDRRHHSESQNGSIRHTEVVGEASPIKKKTQHVIVRVHNECATDRDQI